MGDEIMIRNKSIDEVINTYSDMVYKLSYSRMQNKSDADDIFQEVFMQYIKNRPEFKSEEHEKAWLIRVTINCCKKIWLSSWKRKVIYNKEVSESISFEVQEELDLANAIRRLPSKYRIVIHLFYYEDLTVEQIAEILEKRQSTIRTQLTRARRMLKQRLGEGYNDEGNL